VISDGIGHDVPVTEEERFVTLCRDPLARVLVVVFTWRGDRIRLISGRKATPREQREYEAFR